MSPREIHNIAITGATSGIGLSICEYLRSEGYRVESFSRANGFDLGQGTTISELVRQASDCEVFINNAYHEWAQVDLLYALFAEWKFQDRMIINIGSNSADRTKNFEHKYAIVKGALDAACNQLNQVPDVRCRVVNLRPGWVDTPRVANLKGNEVALEAREVARTIGWLLDLPKHVHVPTVTLLAKSL